MAVPLLLIFPFQEKDQKGEMTVEDMMITTEEDMMIMIEGGATIITTEDLAVTMIMTEGTMTMTEEEVIDIKTIFAQTKQLVSIIGINFYL
jgi:hypothetical protein